MKRKPRQRKKAAPPRKTAPLGLRIVGGKFRGRKLKYGGADNVRPMKDRLREAVFNLLGTDVARSHAVDLFAGTGAMALEALSRGASSATLIEQHRPTAGVIEENATSLGVEAELELIIADTFRWWPRQELPTDIAWTVFCCPPYDLFLDREADIQELISAAAEAAPPESLLVVESDLRFEADRLPDADRWDTRKYPPAQISVLRT